MTPEIIPPFQLADVIAGAIVNIVLNDFPPIAQEISEVLMRHLHSDSVMPDLDIVDPSSRSAVVSAVILHDMAIRAERRADPYENLEEMYYQAELSWREFSPVHD